MTTGERRILQLSVIGLGVFFFFTNLVTDGVTLRSFVPLAGGLLGLVAIEQVRRNQERGL
ncbi:hypothetical protein IEZ26_21895 [Nocardioides cavernae]|uniref:DUF3188 domain-containing protein n=1 Tax=Nocardioides cavernae TaxID=1921566 RepID=A0ABR8NGN5_9ACTN|nr:hypothetical protein [Nocardioides cavernae]MBD3927290.1 hypothetical protein [Nocardioides cavernae]MBM7513107.1 hypothetical protein [Nocardioides cavernae]